MGKSRDARGRQPGCCDVSMAKGDNKTMASLYTDQNGFRTERQGCLQVTGSNCSNGDSGFSLRGVYRAPIGTTRREASCEVGQTLLQSKQGPTCRAYHPGARKDIPAETDAIALLDIAPLLLESLIIHLCHVDLAAQPVAIGRLQGCLARGLVCETDADRVVEFINLASKGGWMLLPQESWPGVDGAEELGVVMPEGGQTWPETKVEPWKLRKCPSKLRTSSPSELVNR